MSKLLYIKANVKPEGQSRTYQISDFFIQEYRKNHPNDQLEILDLYQETIGFLRLKDIETLFSPKTEDSRTHAILKYAYQFAEADKYVIAAPMWNLSIPAILKAYLDYVSVAGIAFQYTEQGSVGLLNGKKAVFIASRGGDYKNSSVEMGERYVRTLLAFFGIEDFEAITADGVDVAGADVGRIIEHAQQKAEKLAGSF